MVSLECATRIVRIQLQLLGLLSPADTERDLNQLPPYVLGIEVVCRRAAEEEFVVNEVLSDHELLVSVGATTPFEGKLMSRDANLHQAIGTCVVSSFIEKSLEKLYEST